MIKQIKTIALIDWLWAGHHPAYFGLYTSALLELGFEVVPVCPKPEEIPSLLAKVLMKKPDSLALLHQPIKFDGYAHVRRIWPSKLRPTLQAIRHYGSLKRILNCWERENGKRVDLLFFACIYDHQFRMFQWVEPFLNRPWSGLYLHARSFRMPGTSLPYGQGVPCPEKIFTLPRLHSVALLDEGVVDKMRMLTQGKRVVTFPDLTDIRLSEPHSENLGLAKKMRQFAGNQKLVGCLGHLQKHKGVLQLVRAAKNPFLHDICFAFVGEVSWHGYSDSEKNEITDAWEKHPRIFCHPLRIPDGERMNSVISACDIIAAPYIDFPHSSNMLTKVALLNRPVIVSDGYLMAERTRRFGLGKTVPEGDIEALATAIRELADDMPGWLSRTKPHWTEYQAEHSYERLLYSFSQLLGEQSDLIKGSNNKAHCGICAENS